MYASIQVISQQELILHHHIDCSGSEVKASLTSTIRKTWVQSLGGEDSPGEEIATHSSILAWRIPWTEEPCGLQSTGSQRVRHDRVTSFSLSLSNSKGSACNVGDLGSIPGWGRSPGEGNGNLLQHSCLENPMDGGAWWAIVHGVAKSHTQLRDFTFTFTMYKIGNF